MDYPRGDALRSFSATVNTTELIKNPTRVTKLSSTLVDIVLTSAPSLVKESGVLDSTISDHFLVYVAVDLKIPKPKARYITTCRYNNYNTEQFSSDISRIPWNILDLMDSLDAKVDGFNDLFLTCLNDHAPVKTVKLKRKSCPFITEDIKQLIVTRNNLHSDWNAFKRLRCNVKLALRRVEVDYYNNQIILSNKNNTASLWKIIRRALPQKSNYDLQYTKDTSALTEEFDRFFISVREKASTASKRLAEMHNLPTAPVASISGSHYLSHGNLSEFKPVLCSDVHKVIMNMSNNKSPGYGKVPVLVIKDCLTYILPVITSIIIRHSTASVTPPY